MDGADLFATLLTLMLLVAVPGLVAFVILRSVKGDVRRMLEEHALASKKSTSKPLLPYQLKPNFFTRSEQQFFNILNSKLDARTHTVFPKVRLGDFVEVEKAHTKNWSWWGKIRSRHVDYLVWDLQANRLLFAIELDGYTHDDHHAKEIDEFKNELFTSAGLHLYRVRVGTNFYEEIDAIIKKHL